MNFKNFLENYPYRNRNFKNEILYAKSKFDETYLYHELLEIYKNKPMIPLHYPQTYDVIDFVSDNSLNIIIFHNKGNI